MQRGRVKRPAPGRGDVRPATRPLLALAAVLALFAAGFLIPATRAVLLEEMVEPLQAQAAPARGLNTGYSAVSLALWGLLGAALVYAGYEWVLRGWNVKPDAAFFLSLAPLLVFGPVYHALLVARAIPLGGAWAYLATEPVIYLTTAALAILGLALGRLFGRPLEGLAFVGMLAVTPSLVRAVDVATGGDLARAGGLVLIATVSAGIVAAAARRFMNPIPTGAVLAVIFAHALDGATTWLTLRDPFGWGFHGFRESNPLSETIVNLSNGWPYFAVKLALPVLLLAVVDAERREREAKDETRAPDVQANVQAFLLFAVFVLGYGPGMSNLMQVVLG